MLNQEVKQLGILLVLKLHKLSQVIKINVATPLSVGGGVLDLKMTSARLRIFIPSEFHHVILRF